MRWQHRPSRRQRPLSLSDTQLVSVMQAAKALAPDKRDDFLRRLSSRLMLLGRFTDADVQASVRAAMAGLVHETDAA